jgi:hypothetical protein
MLRLDHSYHYDLTNDAIDQLVAERKSGQVATAEKPRTKRAPRKKAGA